MIRSSVRVHDNFDRITAEVDRLAESAVQAAAAEAARVAQANATIDLELEVIPAHGDLHGYSAGIISKKTGRASTIRIAHLFDGGTLGNRKKKLRPRSKRKESWPVNRGGTAYTAKRGEIRDGEGVEAEQFFGKARRAGRKAMVEHLQKP